MSLRARHALILATVILCAAAAGALAAGCGDGDTTVTGVITNVETLSLTEVGSFTLRGNNGETILFGVDPAAALDLEEGLIPSHLREHALAVEEVTVFYDVTDDGRFVAFRVEHD